MTEFSPSYRGRVGTWCRSCFAAYMRGERSTTGHEPRACAFCGEQYVPQQLKAAAAYCSRRCKSTAKNAAEKAERDAMKAAAPPRICPYCGEPVPMLARVDAVFCSAQCNQAAHDLVRKMYQRGVPVPPDVTRASIGARDRWRCGICRTPIDPSLRWPHLRSGSIDHVVPVSEGGSSDPSNLRITHLSCNARRRNLGGGEQLAIFG